MCRSREYRSKPVNTLQPHPQGRGMCPPGTGEEESGPYENRILSGITDNAFKNLRKGNTVIYNEGGGRYYAQGSYMDNWNYRGSRVGVWRLCRERDLQGKIQQAHQDFSTALEEFEPGPELPKHFSLMSWEAQKAYLEKEGISPAAGAA